MSNNWKTSYEFGYAVTLITGGYEAVHAAAGELRVAGVEVASVDENKITLRDVKESQFEAIEEIVESRNLDITATYGERKYLSREQVKVRKAFRLNLEPDKWYFSENHEDTYPLMFVREVVLEKDANTGDESQWVTLEMHTPDQEIPRKERVSSIDVASFGLRPATLDDFERYDNWIPPAAKYLISVEGSASPAPDLSSLRHFGN